MLLVAGRLCPLGPLLALGLLELGGNSLSLEVLLLLLQELISKLLEVVLLLLHA